MGAHAHRRKHTTRIRIALAGRLLATSALIGFAAPLLHVQHAGAQSGEVAAARAFDIPAQSLASALNTFGRQSGLQVTLASSTSDGVTSRAVKGTLTPQQALSQLLQGTGIPFRINVDRTAVIGLPDSTGTLPPDTEGALVLDAITVTAGGFAQAWSKRRQASPLFRAKSLRRSPIAR